MTWILWLSRAISAALFLGSLVGAAFAAFHFKSIGFTITMLTMSAGFGYFVYYDVRRILAARAAKK